MARLLVRRLGLMLLIMLVVGFILFIVNEGDPRKVARGVLGPYAQEQQLDIWIQENGYDRPIPVRFLDWVGGVATGDLGESVQYKRPVNEFFWERLGNTGILAGLTFLIMVPLALLLGVLAGMKEGSLQDRTISVASIITTSIPEFASAVILTTVFVIQLKWLPGTSSMAAGWDWMQMILPVTVLVL